LREYSVAGLRARISEFDFFVELSACFPLLAAAADGVDDGFAVAGEADWRIAEGRKGFRPGPFEFPELGWLTAFYDQIFVKVRSRAVKVESLPLTA
jgi:hypothetical protein